MEGRRKESQINTRKQMCKLGSAGTGRLYGDIGNDAEQQRSAMSEYYCKHGQPEGAPCDECAAKQEGVSSFAAPSGSPAPRGLLIHCAHCSQLLTEPGALLFSPPDKNGKTEKHHFCIACFQKIGGLLAQ